MSQSDQSNSPRPKYKPQKLQVRRKKDSGSSISMGVNTEVLLDGEPLRGCYFVKFEVHARKVAKVTLELFAEVDIEADVLLSNATRKPEKGKKLAPYVLSNYGPFDLKKE